MILELLTYINLNIRKDKYFHINKQISNIKTESFRTEGYVCEDYTSYPVVPYIQTNPQRYKGTIGCFLAHKLAINNLINRSKLKNENNYCLILEDDVDIKPVFWDFINVLNIYDKYDIIFFNSGRKVDNNKCIDINQKLWEVYSDYPVFCGAFCYAIQIKKLQKIYDILDNVATYQDLDRFLFTHNELNNLSCQTKLIKVNSRFRSDRDPTHSWRRRKNA